MFSPESQARADELLRLYGASGFVLTATGELGVMIVGNFHACAGGQDVQINASDEERTADAIAKAKEQDDADIAAARAARAAESAAPSKGATS